MFNPQTLDMGSKMSFNRRSSDQNTVSELTSVAPPPCNSIPAPSDCRLQVRHITTKAMLPIIYTIGIFTACAALTLFCYCVEYIFLASADTRGEDMQ